MDDTQAMELIDAYLDRQPLTDEQSDELTNWIKADPKNADAVFHRIFLHSYLRLRLKDGTLPAPSELAVLKNEDFSAPIRLHSSVLSANLSLSDHRKRSFWMLPGILLMTVLICIMAAFGSRFHAISNLIGHPDVLYAYEGFDYPATVLPDPDVKGDIKWPTSGGLQGLAGGAGWADPWVETNSKVAVIVDYSQKGMKWEPTDMRKFGPLGYTDAQGHVLQSTGHQMRTAPNPRSISTRALSLDKFPQSMRDEGGVGRDGSVVWLSFLAQSSFSTAKNNKYSYLLIGSKSVAGLRIGKLGAASTGNWTAVGLQTGAEVNLKSSSVPSGEMVFLVARVIFRPGPEEAVVWINPRLDTEPLVSESSMHLFVPDFRFDGISINANHSTDFDEIRFGSTFWSVAPYR